jgi:hypothetical protein
LRDYKKFTPLRRTITRWKRQNALEMRVSGCSAPGLRVADGIEQHGALAARKHAGVSASMPLIITLRIVLMAGA